ncbi:hypothetical protein [Oricola sp.]|uniref:hypothetical protein n=1 Tax=Oricola sp. TaxID=1979950 RepID=UPI003BA8ED8E
MPDWMPCPALALISLFSIIPPNALADATEDTCNQLIALGKSMVCAGSEPAWALELKCDGGLTANFTDAFSGTIAVISGDVQVNGGNPWQIETSHPLAGTLAATPVGCTDGSDRVYDFTFQPLEVPGLAPPFEALCCHLE